MWLSCCDTPIKQNSPEEEAELKKLKDIEKSVEQTAKKLEKVDGELTGLKNVRNDSSVHNVPLSVHVRNSPALDTQGFLAKDLQVEALGKLDRRVKTAAEQLMKILEQIDALVIYFPTAVVCVHFVFFPFKCNLEWIAFLVCARKL